MAPDIPRGKHTIPPELNTENEVVTDSDFKVDYPRCLDDYRRQMIRHPDKKEWWRKGNPKNKK
jgi:hypothetical protein